MKRVWTNFFSIFSLLLALLTGIGFAALMPQADAAPSAPFRIQSVQVDDTTGQITLGGDRSLEEYHNYTSLKLVAPYRLVIDMPDAQLATESNEIAVNKLGLQRISLQQNQGTFYNAVRITVYVDDYETLNQMGTRVEGNRLQISLTSVPVAGELAEGDDTAQQDARALRQGDRQDWDEPLEIPEGATVINDVFYRDGQLIVIADPGRDKDLIVKNRFVLPDPNRLVIDLDNTMVASKAIVGTIEVSNDPYIDRIRIGQFDMETTRLVVETTQPERFNIYYPSVDKRMLAVSAMTDISMTTLPQDTQMGTLEKITLDKESGVTVLRLLSSSPILHRMSRHNDKVHIELLNVAARPGWVGYDRENFEQIDQMSVENLVVGQPNSKFVLDLKNDRWEADTRLMANGKTLEVILTPAPTTTLTKLAFPATVVVDAGHGGKDKGAIYNGVFEKNLNLKVALKLKKALEDRGVKVHMTRSDDRFLALSQISQFSNRIRPDLFVSVHHNASNNRALSGVETYYYKYDSRRFAEVVHRKLVNTLRTNHRGVRRARFYVVNHTRAPAILCEVGYMSNAQEFRRVVDERSQDLVAQAIAEGVVEYLKSRVSASAR